MTRKMVFTSAVAFALTALVGQFGCDRPQPPADSSPSATAPSPADSQVKTIAVPVEGMSCAACVASVRRNLTALDGVTAVEVSLEHRQAKVRYDENKVSPTRIAESVQKLGYNVGEPVEAVR